MDRLDKALADICHRAEFSAQGIRVATDDGPGTVMAVLGGSIDCHPYAGNPRSPPSAGIPVANLQIIDDYWVHGLDPDQLADITAKLRAQADRLDHEIAPP